MKTNERTINMKKLKKRLKEIYEAIIGSIIIFKDPFDPYHEHDNKSETDKERR